eukprot:Skav236072  [mRNA]  locus=scaffold2211:163348:163878:+ [translate_table: standard]
MVNEDKPNLEENDDEADFMHGQSMEPIENADFSGDDLDPTLHSGYLFVNDSDSEAEPPGDTSGEKAEVNSKATRQAAVESRPEYQELKKLGLTIRPEGCSLGIHPQAQVWRSYGGGSGHYGRSFGPSSGRTPKQALLRVIELMLEGHIKLHPKDKLAKKQLQDVRAARAAEPEHKD